MSHFYEKYDKEIINIYFELNKIRHLFEEEKEYYDNYHSTSLFSLIDDNFFRKLKISKNNISMKDMFDSICMQSVDDSFYDYIEAMLTIIYQSNDKFKILKNEKIADKCSDIFSIINSDFDYLNLKYEFIETKFGITCIVVEKDILVDETAEIVDDKNVLYKIIEYRAKKNDGNVAAKEEILQLIANYVEGIIKDPTLKNLNKRLFDDTSFMLNNLNIRHNNLNVNNTEYYKKTIVEREKWLDYLFVNILLVINSKKENEIHCAISEIK